jgi:hypothetical protein
MVVPNTDTRPFIFIGDDGKKIECRVVAFNIDDSKGTVKAVTWPAIPKSAKCFTYDGGYRAFDPDTGIVSGKTSIQPE